MNSGTHDPPFPQYVINADWITYMQALGWEGTQLLRSVNGILLQLPSCVRSGPLCLGLVLRMHLKQQDGMCE